ncbi:MAG: hypothetical protein R3F60_25780 [bacterium]
MHSLLVVLAGKLEAQLDAPRRLGPRRPARRVLSTVGSAGRCAAVVVRAPGTRVAAFLLRADRSTPPPTAP